MSSATQAVQIGRLPVGQVCPLCGGTGDGVGIVQGVCVRQCCGTLLSWAWTCEAEYNAFYADMTQFHEAQQAAEGHPSTVERDAEHLKAARSRVKLLSGMYDLPYGTKLLDIGAGGGSFVAACKEVGWNVLGLEPCAALAHWARSQGRLVEYGGWQHLMGDWQVITLLDVLEHLTNPLACLCCLRAHLEPGGLLVVEMPEWESAQAKREGLAWRHVLPKQHVCLYSEMAARELFTRAGLAVEAITRPLRGRIGKIVYYLSAT